VSYQWLRCNAAAARCRAIPAATASRYLVTAADRGARLVVRVTVTTGAGTSLAESAATPRVSTR
jgi:hypothetical protein